MQVSPDSAPKGGIGGWVSSHKWAVGGGSAALILAFVYWRKKQAANAAASSQTPGATTTGGEIYEIAPGSLSSDGAYGSSLGYTSGIANGAGIYQSGSGGQVSGVTATSGAANSGSTNAHASAPVAAGIPGWLHIATPAEGSAYFSAGRTVDVLPGGAPQTASALVPFTSGGRVVGNPSSFNPGSSEYVQLN